MPLAAYEIRREQTRSTASNAGIPAPHQWPAAGNRGGAVRDFVVERHSLLDLAARLVDQHFVMRVVLLVGQLESRFDRHQLADVGGRRRRIEHERRLAERLAARVEPVQRPVAGVGREVLMLEAVRQVVAVRDAVAVGDDERRPVGTPLPRGTPSPSARPSSRKQPAPRTRGRTTSPSARGLSSRRSCPLRRTSPTRPSASISTADRRCSSRPRCPERARSRWRRSPARDRARRSRCRTPSRRRRRSRRSSSPGSRASARRAPATRFASATRARCAAMPASLLWSAVRIASTSSAGSEGASRSSSAWARTTC